MYIGSALFYLRQNVPIFTEKTMQGCPDWVVQACGLLILIAASFQAPGGDPRLCPVFVQCYTGVRMSHYPHISDFLLVNFKPLVVIHDTYVLFRALLTSVGVLSRLPTHSPACPQCHAYLQTVQHLIQDISIHNHHQQNNIKV